MLSVSKQCERDNPDLALFKYDKNKQQRLSFIGNANKNVSHIEEWCIRQWYASVIQVASTCGMKSASPNWVAEAFFHEVF